MNNTTTEQPLPKVEEGEAVTRREATIDDLVDAILDHWLLIGALAVFFAIAALSLSLFMDTIYRSESVVAWNQEDPADLGSIAGRFGGLAALAGIGGLGGSEKKEEAIALLTSRAFTERFIVQNELLPILFEDDWDPASGTWAVDDEDQPTLNDAVELFDEDVRYVTEDELTGLITIAIEWKSPELAAVWLERLIDSLNEEMKKRAVDESERSKRFLDAELKSTTSVEVREAIYRLMEETVKQLMFANVKVEYAFRTIDPPNVADEDDYVSPILPLLFLAGAVLGAALGTLVSLVRTFVLAPPAS